MITVDTAPMDYAENGTGDVADFAADDPEEAADPIWSLSGTDQGQFDIANDGVLTFKSPPDHENPLDADGDNLYELMVVATDMESNAASREVMVKVTNVDEEGVVGLSSLQPRGGVMLTATLEDPDGGVSGVTWMWHRSTSDSAGQTCANATFRDEDDLIEDAMSATYTPMIVDDADETDLNRCLRATASYTDAEGDEKTASGVSANVVQADTRNKPPAFPDQDTETEGLQNEEAERSVMESAAADANVGAAVTAEDPNAEAGDILTYTLGGRDAGLFSIGASDGQITVGMGTELNYEEIQTYTVTVTATDSFQESATITLTIKVTDVDEAPTIMVGGLAVTGPSAQDYAENGTGAVATYTASGPDAAGATWSLSRADAGDLSIDRNTGELSFRTSPNFEADRSNVYQVTITANDGSITASRAVTVTVTNVDELGMVSGDDTVSYAENGTDAVATYTAGGPASATWTLSGDDAGDFAISNGGELTFAASPDYEAAADTGTDNVYQVTVDADAGGETDSQAVTVTVTNVDEDGTVTLDPAEPVVGTALTATLSDPDGGVTGETWQWAKSDTMGGTFAPIAGANSDSYTPVGGDENMYLRATASYTDGEGPNKEQMAKTDSAVTPETTTGNLVADRYDTNPKDGRISRGEVGAAVRAYTGGEISSKDDVILVIRQYFKDLGSGN